MNSSKSVQIAKINVNGPAPDTPTAFLPELAFFFPPDFFAGDFFDVPDVGVSACNRRYDVVL